MAFTHTIGEIPARQGSASGAQAPFELDLEHLPRTLRLPGKSPCQDTSTGRINRVSLVIDECSLINGEFLHLPASQ
jgi:hypothetical protein